MEKSNPESFEKKGVADELVIIPYNPEWPRQFEKEAASLREVFKNHQPVIEHIGSTAIHGLDAKPIIDLMIGFEDEVEIEEIIQKIESLGYNHWKEDPYVQMRQFFIKWDAHKTHRISHIHATKIGNDFWTKQIIFRDKMRGNKNLIKEYAELKKMLARKFIDNHDKYIEAKTEFINKVIDS